MYPMVGTQIDAYEEGTVLLDIVDAGKKQLFWRGRGSRKITNASLIPSDEDIRKGVSELLVNFPPPA